MRHVEFTNEAIIKAGQGLLAAGKNITGFAIRSSVGGGNPARLKQVWDEHISNQMEVKNKPVAELPVEVAEEVAVLSKALTERINQLAATLNDKAVTVAEQRVSEVMRTAGEQREQAKRELADASQTVEDLESKLDASEAAGALLENRLNALQAENQAQAVELAQLRERMSASEKAAQAAEQTNQEQRRGATQEMQRLMEQVAKAEADRERAEQAAATAREEAAKLKGQVEMLQKQAAELMQALTPPKPITSGKS